MVRWFWVRGARPSVRSLALAVKQAGLLRSAALAVGGEIRGLNAPPTGGRLGAAEAALFERALHLLRADAELGSGLLDRACLGRGVDWVFAFLGGHAGSVTRRGGGVNPHKVAHDRQLRGQFAPVRSAERIRGLVPNPCFDCQTRWGRGPSRHWHRFC
jgi:hypothetical protein